MFIAKKRKYWEGVSLLLAGCFLLSSCSLFSGNSEKSAKEIESVVTDYLDSIVSGDFADNAYKSDLSLDAPFADLMFSDQADEELMKSALEQIAYKIDTSEGNEKDGKGSCDVVLTVIDLDAIIKYLGKDYNAERLRAAIIDKKAPAKELNITLDLEYDKDKKVWLLSDTSELSGIIGEPFAELKLPSVSDAVDVAEAFFKALKVGDFDTISALTNGSYNADSFIDSKYSVSSTLFDAVFSNMSYEIIEPGTSTNAGITLQIDFLHPDYLYSITYITSHLNTMSEIFQPVALAVANHEEGTVEYGEFLDDFCELLAAEIQDSNMELWFTDTIDLYYDRVADTWYVENVPGNFCVFSDLENNIDPMHTMESTDCDEIMLYSYEDLLDEGLITKEQFDQCYVLDSVYDSSEVLASIDYQGWFDYVVGAYTDEYGAGTTSVDYQLFFLDKFPGLVLNYEFTSKNETDSIVLKKSSYICKGDYCLVYYHYPDNSELPQGSYRVVITLADNTVIVDQTIAIA